MRSPRGRIVLVAAIVGALLAGVVPAHAAGRLYRLGIIEFRHFYEQQTCPVAYTATEVRSTVRQRSQERFKKGDCVQVRFLVDGGGATDLATGAGPAPDASSKFELRFIGEDGKVITTVPASVVTAPDLYGGFVNIGNDWPAGDITVEARAVGPDTGVGKFKMQVNALGTRLLLDKPAYTPGEDIVVRGVTWKDYHRITAAISVMSYPEDPQYKDNVPGAGTVKLTRADGKVVSKDFTADTQGLFSVTFSSSDYGNVSAGAASDFVKSLRLVADASYEDPLTGTWGTAGGDPDALAFVKFQSVPTQAQVRAHYTSETGWVEPGAEYVHQIEYRNLSTKAATNVVITDQLPADAIFLKASPAPTSVSGRTLTWRIGTLKAGSDWSGDRRIIIHARAKNEAEDRTIVWKDLSSTASLAQTGTSAVESKTRGPKVTELDTARYGTRPFPVVLADYQDAFHSPTRPGWYFDQMINEGAKDSTLVSLYDEMSFGQLFPSATVPSLEAKDTTFGAASSYKWATPKPRGACLGVSLITPNPTSDVSTFTPSGTRINGGWYRLPGTEQYYGGDEASFGEIGIRVAAGLGVGHDGACGPVGKIAYDAASIADPDIDYNQYDTDRNGVVDFFMVVSRGLGGNGDSQLRGGYDAVWPHSSSLESYFIDENGQLGYVSHDQLRDRNERPLWWPNADARKNNTISALTTKNMGDDLKAYVRVGPYNANPEVSSTSVVAHEYGHSLGLPDFYSGGSRLTVEYWDLMSTDYSQFMSIFSRQDLGWVVPKVLANGTVNAKIKESKTDSHRIEWRDSKGRPYVLSGQDVHNADAYYVPLQYRTLLDKAPSGKRVWYSTSGNDFGCPGKTLDLPLPLMEKAASGDTVKLSFKSLYEIEWDYDYGFVMVSADAGNTWTALESEAGSTTPQAYNPNANGCQTQYGNGISGTSAQRDFPLNLVDRSPAGGTASPDYLDGTVFDESFDLSQFAGKPIILRFAYSTDAGLAKKGWFVDDVKIVNETSNTTYFSDDVETTKPQWIANGWTVLPAGPGTADHGYYLELRDRISFDYDGRGQGDRTPINWMPGVSLWFTDELAGYGNTGEPTGDSPNQSPVDARPQQGATAPRLSDAAFYPLPGINSFSDKARVDNYGDPNADDNVRKLDFSCFTMKVNSISGLGSPGATAALSLTANAPKCRKVSIAAVLGGRITKPATKPRGGSLPATGVEAGWLGFALLVLAAAMTRRVWRRPV